MPTNLTQVKKRAMQQGQASANRPPVSPSPGQIQIEDVGSTTVSNVGMVNANPELIATPVDYEELAQQELDAKASKKKSSNKDVSDIYDALAKVDGLDAEKQAAFDLVDKYNEQAASLSSAAVANPGTITTSNLVNLQNDPLFRDLTSGKLVSIIRQNYSEWMKAYDYAEKNNLLDMPLVDAYNNYYVIRDNTLQKVPSPKETDRVLSINEALKYRRHNVVGFDNTSKHNQIIEDVVNSSSVAALDEAIISATNVGMSSTAMGELYESEKVGQLLKSGEGSREFSKIFTAISKNTNQARTLRSVANKAGITPMQYVLSKVVKVLKETDRGKETLSSIENSLSSLVRGGASQVQPNTIRFDAGRVVIDGKEVSDERSMSSFSMNNPTWKTNADALTYARPTALDGMVVVGKDSNDNDVEVPLRKNLAEFGRGAKTLMETGRPLPVGESGINPEDVVVWRSMNQGVADGDDYYFKYEVLVPDKYLELPAFSWWDQRDLKNVEKDEKLKKTLEDNIDNPQNKFGAKEVKGGRDAWLKWENGKDPVGLQIAEYTRVAHGSREYFILPLYIQLPPELMDTENDVAGQRGQNKARKQAQDVNLLNLTASR